jgi:hypothetical protein
LVCVVTSKNSFSSLISLWKFNDYIRGHVQT